jgi:hypothetical protein
MPLAFAFYLRRETLSRGCIRVRGKAVVFADKFTQGFLAQTAENMQ